MAIISSSAGRGAAIRNTINTASAVAAAAAAAQQLRNQQAYNPNPVYVAPRAPIASAPATSLIQQSGRPTAPTRAPAPPPNIIAQSLARSAATGPTAASAARYSASAYPAQYEEFATNFLEGTPHHAASPNRAPFPDQKMASAMQTLTQQSAGQRPIEPVNQEHLRYLAQQQIAQTFPAMAGRSRNDEQTLAALQLAQQQGFQYRSPVSTGYDGIENVRASNTNRPAVTPVGPNRANLLQQQFQDYEAMRVQGGLPETRIGGFGPQYQPEPGVVYRPQTVSQRQQTPTAQQVDQQRANIRAQIMQIENQYRMGYQPGPTDADTLVQLYAREQALARGENGPLDTLTNAGGSVWEAARRSPVVDNSIGNAILDAAEQLADTSVEVSRPAIGWFNSAMDWYSNEIQQPIKRSTAELLYNYALNDPEQSSLEINDFGSGLSFLFALPTMVLIEADDALGDNSTRENIIAAYEAGGPDAAWEVVIGLADGAPMPVEMTWKIIGELLTDPATLLPWVGGAGRVIQGGGRGMRLASGATRTERVAGTVLERGGQAVDIAARGLDEIAILPFRGVRRAWQGAGRGTPGAFQMSPQVQQADAINALKRAELARNQGADELGSRPRPEPNQETPPPNVDPDDSSLVDLQLENGIDETYVSFGDRTITVRRGGVGYEIVDEAGNALASFTTRRAAVRAAGRTAKGIETEFEDVVVRGADGTIDDADLIQRANPETGEVLGPLRAADIPDDLPMIRAAVARGATTPPGRSASRVVGDPTLVTNTRGAFLNDLVALRGARAVAEGDMATARQMEGFLRDSEGFAVSTIGKEPNYQIWQEGGTAVDVPVRSGTGGFSLSDAEMTRLGKRGKPNQTFNGLLKQAYEHAYLLWNEATNIAPMFARRFGGENLPTDASQLFRVSGDTSFANERFLYLAERYVKTADEDEARRIMNELLDTDPWAEKPIEYVQEAFGAPYLTAIPPGIKPTDLAESTIRKEVHDVLRSARRSWQDARNIRREAQVADQIGGGLKGESKKAAKRMRDAAQEEAEQKARGHAQAMRERQAETSAPRIEWRLASEGSEEAGFGPTGAGRMTADDLAKHPSGRAVMEAENLANGRKIKRHTWTSKKGERVEGYQLFENGQYVSTAQARRAADFLNERIVRNEADEAFSTESILNRSSKQPGPNDLGFVDPLTRLSMRISDRIQQYSDATVTAAPDELFADIVDPDTRYLLEHAAEGFRREDALLLDKPLPDWKPPRKPRPGDPEVWRVSDALAEIEDARRVKPDFNYEAAYDVIAFKAAGLNVPPPTKAARGKVIKKLDTAYDGYMNGIQRQHRRYGPLTGVRNIVGDTTGQIWQGVVSGRWETLGAVSPYRIGRDIGPFRNMDRDARRFADAIDDATLRETGQIIPLDLMPSTTRGEDPFAGLPSANKRVADKSWAVRAGANMWTVPGFKDWLTLIDIETRISTFRTLNKQFIKSDAQKAFAKRLRQEAGDDITAHQWRKAIEAEARRKANGKWNGLYSPGDVEVALRNMTTKNTDLARAWQKQLNEASARAVKGTQDTWFTYKNLNIDEKARRIFVFHYWQSRAIPFHIRAALRNPMLLNGYYKMWQELEQMGEEGRYPWYLDRMFQFYQSPAGIEAYFDPLGILLPTTLFDAYNEQGGAAAVFINQMSPLIGAAISVAGMSEFSPNLFGIKNDENFIRKFINYLTGQGHDISELPVIGQYFDPNTMLFTIPTEELTNLLIGAANQALINAGLPAVQPFEPFNRGANELDQLRTWVQQVATEQFGPRYGVNGEGLWTAEQMAEYEEALLGVQSGMEGNDILDLAMERYGNEEGLSAALSLIAPGGAVVNSRFRTDQMDLANRFADQGYTGTPEEQAASDFRNEAKATDPAWVIANQQWHNLGTPEQREAYALYNQLIYNPEELESSGYMLRLSGYAADDPNQWIDASMLLGMDEDARRELVEQWFTKSGELEGIQQLQAERDAFKEANPEIADFRTYIGGVYDYEGGAGAFIDMMLPINPNFKRAYDERREYLESQGKKGSVLEAELEDWATSQQAFFAATGQQFSIYDDKPLPVYDPTADPLANPQFAGVMDMGPQSTGGNQYPQSDDNKRDKAADSAFEQSIEWTDENNRKQWATSLAEQMYGDAWNEQTGEWETWAYKDKNYRENVLGLPDGNTDYYMDESPPQPGKSSNDNRFQEWVLWMQRTNPGIPASELTPMAWAAWETGTWEEYMASISPPAQQYEPLHAVWARHLYN